VSRPTFAAYRARAPTDDISDVGPAPLLTTSMCKAPGCYAIWTVDRDMGGGYCSAHA
jgi:hypothetical protein